MANRPDDLGESARCLDVLNETSVPCGRNVAYEAYRYGEIPQGARAVVTNKTPGTQRPGTLGVVEKASMALADKAVADLQGDPDALRHIVRTVQLLAARSRNRRRRN